MRYQGKKWLVNDWKCGILEGECLMMTHDENLRTTPQAQGHLRVHSSFAV